MKTLSQAHRHYNAFADQAGGLDTNSSQSSILCTEQKWEVLYEVQESLFQTADTLTQSNDFTEPGTQQNSEFENETSNNMWEKNSFCLSFVL